MITSHGRKPGSKYTGTTFLVYSDEAGDGKTSFAMTFPNLIYIDAENGIGHYEDTEKGKNLKEVVDTQSYSEVEDVLDELIDSADECKGWTLVIDGEKRIKANLEESLMAIRERKARAAGKDELEAGTDWGFHNKSKFKGHELQNRKITLANHGLNIISVTQGKNATKTDKNGVRVSDGWRPDIVGDGNEDYDVVIRLFRKNGKFYGEIEKDRAVEGLEGQIVENPSYELWADALSKNKNKKVVKKNFSEDMEVSKHAHVKEAADEGLPFVTRVKSFYDGLAADEKNEFIEAVVKEAGSNQFAQMTKAQQNKVLKLIEKY